MPYRVEEASTGRAGCKNTECNKAKVKILKGELRFGTWVEGEQFQSWAWKHWGCVTPRQIASLKDSLGEDEDVSELDGFEELSEENQEKVRQAVAQGHVADEDWRGDVEVNRPGKTGFRVRGKKKQDESKDDDDKKETKPAKKRGKRAATEDEDEEKAPASKKTKAAPKKKAAAAKESDDNEEETAPKKAKRGRKPKAAKDDAGEESKAADVESQKESRARRAAGRASKKSSE